MGIQIAAPVALTQKCIEVIIEFHYNNYVSFPVCFHIFCRFFFFNINIVGNEIIICLWLLHQINDVYMMITEI